jgi:uncharacterized protein
MPLALLKRVCPTQRSVQGHWFLRLFGARVADPRLWKWCRRGVTAAFGAGLAICFIPLPVHFIVATLVALTWRINIPVIYTTILIINPLTVVPVYYLAYRLGAMLLNSAPHRFAFHMSWDWLEHGLGPMWEPFLLGCLVCGVVGGVLGYVVIELIWRWRAGVRYRNRHLGAPRPDPRRRGARPLT